MTARILTCRLQNRLGALDRLLGALTHRGILTESISSQVDTETDSVLVTFVFTLEPSSTSSDDKEIAKLLKSLEKQIYVLQVSANTPHLYSTIPTLSTPL